MSYDYEECISICLKVSQGLLISVQILRRDYEQSEVHELLLKVFIELGSENSLVMDARQQLKAMLLHKN